MYASATHGDGHTIVDNTYGVYLYSGDATISNNIIAFNLKSGVYTISPLRCCPITTITGTRGVVPPAGLTYPWTHCWRCRESGDFHILPNSPCRNAGDIPRLGPG